MIRLPASTIVLSTADLKDFDRRRRRRRIVEAQVHIEGLEERMQIQLARYGEHNLPGMLARAPERLHSTGLSKQHRIFGNSRAEPAQELVSDDEPNTVRSKEETEDADLAEEHSVVINLPEQEHGYVSVGLGISPENPSLGSRRPSLPSKHDFHYGGFVESPEAQPAGSPSPSLPYSMLITTSTLSMPANQR